MKASTFRHLSKLPVLVPAFAVFLTPLARAQDASAWDRGQHSAVRLIAGPPVMQDARTLRAGVEITLDPQWKTYWRYPGDSGVPPRFDFSGSTNVKDATVLWPAPARFEDGSGTSIGYGTRVIFPLHVEPKEAGKPVALRLKLDYAVCEKLCVPVDAKAQIALPAAASGHGGVLDASEQRVPRRVALGAEGPLAIVGLRRETAERTRVIVDVKSADPASVDLLAEGPSADWSLPLPEKLAGAPPGIVRFAFLLEGMPPGTDPRGAALTLTATTPQRAIEVVAHLD